MHTGTAQDQRLAEALQPDYLRPDEFDLAARLRMTLAQAQGLRFIKTPRDLASSSDDSDQTETWQSVLLQDETVVLADLVGFPVAHEHQLFLTLVSWAEPGEIWHHVFERIERYDTWLTQLSDTADISNLPQMLRGRIVQDLAAPLASCLAQLSFWMRTGTHGLASPTIRDLDQRLLKLHSAWGINSNAATRLTAPLTAPLTAGTHELRSRASVIQALRQLWLAWIHAVRSIQPFAQQRMTASLCSGNHEPAMGLLLAFLQVFQNSRSALNSFPRRLTDFYHFDVLGLGPRAPGSEHVHLLLNRDPRYSDPVVISAGTRFVGGKDTQGKLIKFATDQTLEVTQSQVAALFSLRLESNPLISPEHELGYSTAVKSEVLTLQKPENAYVSRAPWWPLLGGREKSSAANAVDAQLGLAISSPILALKEGEREILLRLQIAHPADHDESLKTLLRTPEKSRDKAWIASVITRLEQFERQQYPSRVPDSQKLPSVAIMADELIALAEKEKVELSSEGDPLLSYLLLRCIATSTADALSERLGRLFSAWLLTSTANLLDVNLKALRRHAHRLLNTARLENIDIDDPLYLLKENAPAPQRPLIFDRLFQNLWRARLSGAQTWFDVAPVHAQRCFDQGQDNLAGTIDLFINLHPEHPAVIACAPELHGAGWPAQACLQLHLDNRACIYAYSLLRHSLLREVQVEVRVRGVRDLVLHNQLGRLDPSKPFVPFGPLPELGNYVIFGSQELASKPICELSLNFQWGRLPSVAGGFAEHYQGYPGQWQSERFKVRANVLRDGQWRASGAAPLALFAQATAPTGNADDLGSRRIPNLQQLAFPSIDLRRFHQPVNTNLPGPSTTAIFDFGLQSRNGFFRLELCEPEGAFGHSLYPQLLTQTLTRNARLKLQLPLPREPYTPTLESLTVDFTATQTLNPQAETSYADNIAMTPAPPHQLLHLHPFGIAPVTRQLDQQHARLLPNITENGNLYIGLSGPDPQGTLSLFFHLRQEIAQERFNQPAPFLQWAVWTAHGWQKLETYRQLADSTQGFLRSGIVLLNLPSGMCTRCPQLPHPQKSPSGSKSSLTDTATEGYYWIRLSANWGFDFLAGLYGIYAQAISARRTQPATADEGMDPLPPGTISRPLASIAGLRNITQVGASFGRSAHDDQAILKTRASERLRHKNRGVTPWDFERLVLDAFPQVLKVKCFSHLHLSAHGRGAVITEPAKKLSSENPSIHRQAHHAAGAGHVMLVVVPAPRRGSLFDSLETPRFDAATLAAIREYLLTRASPSIQLIVRNPAYERIQVRCTLSLTPDCHPGSSLRNLNRGLVDFLSPWHAQGFGPDFDWTVRADVVESHLRTYASVANINALSLLHIVRNDQHRYTLRDTARQRSTRAEQRQNNRQVHCSQPWSLMLPTRSHLIELANTESNLTASATGIKRLEIGNTFVIGGRS